MDISRANGGRWYHGLNPSAENIAQITQSLKTLNPTAAKEFGIPQQLRNLCGCILG
jgi:hypothetical protein